MGGSVSMQPMFLRRAPSNQPTPQDEAKAFIFENTGICGCGRPDEALRFLFEILKLAPFYENSNWEKVKALIPNEGMCWFSLYQLDHLGLIKHGNSVADGWLTEKGQAVLDKLDFLFKEAGKDRSDKKD